MADLKRTRTRPSGQGFTSPVGMQDAMAQTLIEELQSRVTALSVPTTTTTAQPDNRLARWAASEVTRLTPLIRDLTRKQASENDRISALERATKYLHTYIISNDLSETIPPHSVIRTTDYDPDTNVYVAAKPQGLGVDKPELLLITGWTQLEDGGMGVAFRPSDTVIKAQYDAPDTSFEPDAGTGYVTQADSWRLMGLAEGDGFAFFKGMGAATGEWDTTEGLVWIRPSVPCIPPLLKTTTAAAAGAISARQVNDSFAVTGITRSFTTTS